MLPELDDDLDSSEGEWGEGREDMEYAEKGKNINMDTEVFTMRCLDFILDKINLLGLLHLDAEGW